MHCLLDETPFKRFSERHTLPNCCDRLSLVHQQLGTNLVHIWLGMVGSNHLLYRFKTCCIAIPHIPNCSLPFFCFQVNGETQLVAIKQPSGTAYRLHLRFYAFNIGHLMYCLLRYLPKSKPCHPH